MQTVKYLRLFLLLSFSLLIFACSQGFDIEKENKKSKKALMDKIEKGIELEDHELSNLIAILSGEENYDLAIDIFNKLEESEDYSKNRHSIYNSLSTFYGAKAMKTYDEQKRRQLIDRAVDYLEKGFSINSELPMAHYQRAQVLATFRCLDKAKIDREKANELAQTKDLIYIDDGIYFDKDKFVKFVNKMTAWFENAKDNCLLEG